MPKFLVAYRYLFNLSALDRESAWVFYCHGVKENEDIKEHQIAISTLFLSSAGDEADTDVAISTMVRQPRNTAVRIQFLNCGGRIESNAVIILPKDNIEKLSVEPHDLDLKMVGKMFSGKYHKTVPVKKSVSVPMGLIGTVFEVDDVMDLMMRLSEFIQSNQLWKDQEKPKNAAAECRLSIIEPEEHDSDDELEEVQQSEPAASAPPLPVRLDLPLPSVILGPHTPKPSSPQQRPVLELPLSFENSADDSADRNLTPAEQPDTTLATSVTAVIAHLEDDHDTPQPTSPKTRRRSLDESRESDQEPAEGVEVVLKRQRISSPNVPTMTTTAVQVEMEVDDAEHEQAEDSAPKPEALCSPRVSTPRSRLPVYRGDQSPEAFARMAKNLQARIDRLGDTPEAKEARQQLLHLNHQANAIMTAETVCTRSRTAEKKKMNSSPAENTRSTVSSRKEKAVTIAVGGELFSPRSSGGLTPRRPSPASAGFHATDRSNAQKGRLSTSKPDGKPVWKC